MDTAEKVETNLPSPNLVNGRERGQIVVPRKAPWAVVSSAQSEAQIVNDALKEVLTRIRQDVLSARDLAYEVIEFFSILVRHETGLTSPRRGLSLALDKLCAGRAWTSLSQGVMRWAEKTIAQRAENKFVDSAEVQTDLEYILDWYAIRSISMESLDEHATLDSNYDQFFKLNIFHDQYQQNNHGFTVQAGLALFGRANQNLWLKIFVNLDGEYILPRPGWDSWIDDTEIFSGPNDRNATCFSAIVPLVPEAQRTVLDGINVFIPYAALDLPPDKQEVEIEVSLYNERGEQLLRATSTEVMSIPQYGDSSHKMLSYQALGLWSEDVVHGCGIRNLFSTVQKSDSSDKSRHEIKITMDLDMMGQPGEVNNLEVRCVHVEGAHADGELIASKQPDSKDPTIIKRFEITLHRPVETLHDYSVTLPLSSLDLDGSEEQISVEVCLVSPVERVLCGSVTQVFLSEAVLAEIKKKDEPKKESWFRKLLRNFIDL